MSHKDNQDLRNTGDGGWFYAENELFSVFAPLIGADGIAVYMAMCRLIPLAAIDVDRPVTVRAVSEASCVSLGTTHRKMALIVGMGMLDEQRHSRQRPCTYKLLSLRKLAQVGVDALKARVGVLRGNTDPETVGVGTIDTPDGNGESHAHSLAGRDDANRTTLTGILLDRKPPARSGEDGVPPGNTEEVRWKSNGSEGAVFQKQAPVFQKEASVFQNGGSYKEEEEEEDKDSTPPTPASGGVVSSIATSRHPGKSNGKNLPGEALTLDPEGARAMQDAVAKVMRECSLSEPRLAVVIERAMLTEASGADDTPDWNGIAEAMIEARALHSQYARAGLIPYPKSVRRFFAEGLWKDHGVWGIDHAEVERRRNARIGSSRTIFD
jgi:hypothetical protein